jgi:hypothetical protein
MYDMVDLHPEKRRCKQARITMSFEIDFMVFCFGFQKKALYRLTVKGRGFIKVGW